MSNVQLGDLHHRVGPQRPLDQDALQGYEEMLRDGMEPPPSQVVFDGSTYAPIGRPWKGPITRGKGMAPAAAFNYPTSMEAAQERYHARQGTYASVLATPPAPWASRFLAHSLRIHHPEMARETRLRHHRTLLKGISQSADISQADSARTRLWPPRCIG